MRNFSVKYQKIKWSMEYEIPNFYPKSLKTKIVKVISMNSPRSLRLA